MVQKCIENITAHPDYEMSPTEKAYREKYLELLRRREILESEIEKNKLSLDRAKKEYHKQKMIFENQESVFERFQGWTIVILIFLSCFILAISVWSIDEFLLPGTVVFAVIIDIILYNIVVSSSRTKKEEEQTKLNQKNKELNEIQNLYNRNNTELNGLPKSIDSLKNEFLTWAKNRNELIDVFSSKKLHEYLEFPFEPILDDQYRPIGTDENPRLFIVYSKKINQSYKYHRLSSCIKSGSGGTFVEIPWVEAEKLGMDFCYTCCLFHFNDYKWIHTVQYKYTEAIENLKKYDILVDLASDHHTRVVFLPSLDALNPAKEHSNSPEPSIVPNHLEQKIASLEQENLDLISEIDRLQTLVSAKDSEMQSLIVFRDIFYPKMEDLSQKYSTIFAGYPTLDAFYQQVVDKRFHRSMYEDLSFTSKINITCLVRSKDRVYKTSLDTCTCPDFQKSHVVCKHMLFLAYNTGVILLNKQRMEKNLKIYLDELRSTPPKK